MQIALVGALVLAVVYFVALRPKEPAVEPVAATPATQTQPAADAGGAEAQTAIGKTIETAKNGAAAADSATKARESQTGEDSGASSASASGSAAPSSSGSTATATTPASAKKKAAEAEGEEEKISAGQRRADSAIRSIQRDLAARRVVVVLVWAKGAKEDTILYKRIKNDISRRGGKVRPYFINVGEVGRYDGLLSGLALAQTPSTIVIAPSNEAKVLGGLTSVERIDRLTSAALQIKPAPTTP